MDEQKFSYVQTVKDLNLFKKMLDIDEITDESGLLFILQRNTSKFRKKKRKVYVAVDPYQEEIHSTRILIWDTNQKSLDDKFSSSSEEI